MKVLRRLYGYLRPHRGWAVLAFGSMIVFALTQTVLAAMVQPLFDEVLTPPGARVEAEPNRRVVAAERMIQENLPALHRAKERFDGWWNSDPSLKWRRVLTVLLIVFLIRAVTSFTSEY